MQNQNNNQKGYTIIETMIAVSLFLVVISIGMSALLNANLIHQKSRDTRSIMDNLSFIMEDISRNLRTGSSYYCIALPDTFNFSMPKSGQDCQGIAFEPALGTTSPNDQWVYYVDNGRILKSTQGPYTDPSTNANYIPLTPDEVVIDAVSGFSVLGAESPSAVPNDFQQPFVAIRLSGKITFKDVSTSFSLQTSISQRLIDI